MIPGPPSDAIEVTLGDLGPFLTGLTTFLKKKKKMIHLLNFPLNYNDSYYKLVVYFSGDVT